MQKSRINLTLDADLIDFIKEYAETQRTTVSEVFTQFALKLKRVKENDPTETILADPDFSDSLPLKICQLAPRKDVSRAEHQNSHRSKQYQ